MTANANMVCGSCQTNNKKKQIKKMGKGSKGN